jgi:hypothetical protein
MLNEPGLMYENAAGPGVDNYFELNSGMGRYSLLLVSVCKG